MHSTMTLANYDYVDKDDDDEHGADDMSWHSVMNILHDRLLDIFDVPKSKLYRVGLQYKTLQNAFQNILQISQNSIVQDSNTIW